MVTRPGLQLSSPARRSQANQLLAGGVGAAVIRHGHFDANNRRDHHNILFHAAGHGSRRIAIGAGQGVGGNPLLGQCPGLCHQIFNAARDTISTQQPHHRRNAILHKHAELALRHSGSRALFPAAAGDMDVDIQIARSQNPALQVKNFYFRQPLIALNDRRNAADLLADHQHILHAHGRRGIDLGVLQQFNHGYFAPFGSRSVQPSR